MSYNTIIVTKKIKVWIALLSTGSVSPFNFRSSELENSDAEACERMAFLVSRILVTDSFYTHSTRNSQLVPEKDFAGK